ncbi:MAG: phosphoribosylamine--glycine ligase [Rikenellaceae bacterium]|nr:phosphoribosylamine--glycine ligase [Rikenellaceae bacterium]
MKVLVIGSGGREHAIVEAISRSPKATKIYAAPGNAGIAQLAECVAIKDTDVERLVAFAKENNIELTVVGPEAALAVGVVDRFREEGLNIFGPTKAATEIESSKDFAKRLMVKYDVPTAAYATFSDFDAALDYVKQGSLPTVLKYDGLAAGKGVVIAQTMEEAEATLRDMLLDTKFGEGRVVIEEFLTGEEFSLMCFVAGNKICPMPVAQDHKRAYDNDEGPNTGGMGAYTELPFITADDHAYAMERIMQRVADAMVAEGTPFTGVLYGGLMKTPNGIKVIEFNARFGDPETEVVLPRLKSDAVDLFMAVAKGEQPAAEWSEGATLGIVLASKGYPGSYDKGAVIRGIENVESKIYHMGTAIKDGALVTAGGRVMIVVAEAPTLREAQQRAQEDIAKIECDNLFHRTDIGNKAFR